MQSLLPPVVRPVQQISEVGCTPRAREYRTVPALQFAMHGVLKPASAPITSVLKRALNGGYLSDAAPRAVFFDLDAFTAECKSLVKAFPRNALHGFAVKACPVVGVVRAAYLAGMGGECASEGEVALCLAAGIPPAKIIFDSPAKTDAVLLDALKKGVHINADNFDEIEQIDTLMRLNGIMHASVGLRINPQIGAGTISMTSTAGLSNKFGVPLREVRAEIIAMFELYSFLNCVHVHVGSQGVSPQQLVDGATAAVQLADEINGRVPGRITTIDIGGGLSVDYGGDTKPEVITFSQFAEMLPEALSKYRIVTEFGRRLAAPVGWIAAKVQAVKSSGPKRYIICHAGADLCMRAAYAPEKWRHEIELRDAKGGLKDGPTVGKFDVAGPLCFSGDIIATDREYQQPEVGDIMVIRDAGGYTLGMYSRHTSQLVPGMYGYRRGAEIQVLKKPETLDELVHFWGGRVACNK